MNRGFHYIQWIWLRENHGKLILGPLLCLVFIFTQGSREIIPTLDGGKIQDLDDHIKEVTIACGILGVQEEDVFIRLFSRGFIESVAKWF